MDFFDSLVTESLRSRVISAGEATTPPLPPLVYEPLGLPRWLRMAHICLLLLADLLALLAAMLLSYLLWARLVRQQQPWVYIELTPLLLLFLLGYAGAGLYPGTGVGPVETLRRLSYSTSFVFLTLAAASFVLRLPLHYSRMTFAIAWGASLVLMPLSRALVFSAVSRWQWACEPAVLIGSRRWVQRIVQPLANAQSFKYRLVAVLSSDPSYHGYTLEGLPVLGGPNLAPRLADRGIHVALVEDGEERDYVLSQFQQYFRHVVIIHDCTDLPVERVRVCNLGGVLGIEFTNNLLRWPNRVIKRTLRPDLRDDIAGAHLPLIALGGLLVKLLSRGPFFFCQKREGVGGHPIKVWKIRTMYQDAEQRLEAFLSTNPELRHEWEERFKLVHDPRVIRGIGIILRRLSVDELPQFWSVVRGKMSLVGPRPFPEYHLRRFPLEFRQLRHRVCPGLTGMWQVMVRSNGGLEAPQMYDTYYIRNWSIWLDLWILSRTVQAVLLGKGAR